MTTIAVDSQTTRSALVARIRARLERETFPRAIVLVLLLAAGGAAFLCSAVALDAGVESMAGRYALATVSGYVVFLALIRVWIAIRRGWSPREGDVSDGFDLVSEVEVPRSVGSADGLAEAASDGFDWSGDPGELGWFVVAIVIAAAGLLACGLVVYSAPVLLAEVALDAALVGAAYRKLRHEDRGYWATTAIRQTRGSAAMLVTFMTVLGFAFQKLAPEALSIGDVLRHFLAR